MELPPQEIHLPTEIVVQIMTAVAADGPQRQLSLYACCLVSRQWYSASIALLYEKPQIAAGTAFKKFAATISPPIGVRKSKWNLGSFVHRLDLSSLVHHSSNSLTARLLGRVKENLEVFIAPRVSFAVNSLPALSKCTKLRHLDLSLVGDNIPFLQLKGTFRNLSSLVSLRLPQSTSIASPEPFTVVPWPPHLCRLQFSGRFSPLAMSTFSWPPSLTTLAFKNCLDLSVINLSSLISSPDLNRTLKRLTISSANRSLSPESINAILAFLPGLSYLSIPGDMVNKTFFDFLSLEDFPELEVLEFGAPNLDPSLYFTTENLLNALDLGLPNLRSVGFAEVFCTYERMKEDDELELILFKRTEERTGLPGTVRNEVCRHIQTGVYYI